MLGVIYSVSWSPHPVSTCFRCTTHKGVKLPRAWPWSSEGKTLDDNAVSGTISWPKLINSKDKLGEASARDEDVDTVQSYSRNYSRNWTPTFPLLNRPRRTHNAASLAYLGDAVYELYARRHFLTPPKNLTLYSKLVEGVSRCEAQDALLRELLQKELLTEEERDIMRWGKNAPGSNTRAKTRAGAAAYSSASALETLVGYLFLSDPQRLAELMETMGFSCGLDEGPDPLGGQQQKD